MSTGITSVVSQDALSRSQKMTTLTLPFVLTAGVMSLHRPAKGAKMLIEGGTGAALVTITQAAVDNLLAVNDVVVATAFGTTAMVLNNTVAFVIDCGGQIRDVGATAVSLEIAGVSSSALGLGTLTALTNAVFTAVQVYVTPAGNLAGRATMTGVSAVGSSGSMTLRIDAFLK